MSERLVIKNFGPIKHVDLDIKKVNVLIGDQGTGKSAIARLLNLFSLIEFLFSDFEERKQLVNDYGFFFRDDTFIEYTNSFFFIKYNKNSSFDVEYIENNKNRLYAFKDLYDSFLVNYDEKLKQEYYFLNEWFFNECGKIKYIPAERISINVFQNRVTKQLNIDQYVIDYANDYFLSREKVKNLTIEHLNNVEYSRIGTDDWVFYNGEELLLHSTSSGFQSSIPLVIYLEYFSRISKELYKLRFIVEEPELNLFPSAQKRLTDYMINRCSNEKYSLFITTHSPYILTSLNNLMQAFIVGENNAEKVNDIIDKKYWLNPKDVSAYMLTKDGFAENIIAEDGLIMTEKIDAVSDVLNGLYDKLLDIKYSNNQ